MIEVYVKVKWIKYKYSTQGYIYWVTDVLLRKIDLIFKG